LRGEAGVSVVTRLFRWLLGKSAVQETELVAESGEASVVLIYAAY
jgi:hypothetical protein